MIRTPLNNDDNKQPQDCVPILKKTMNSSGRRSSSIRLVQSCVAGLRCHASSTLPSQHVACAMALCKQRPAQGRGGAPALHARVQQAD